MVDAIIDVKVENSAGNADNYIHGIFFDICSSNYYYYHQ